MKTSCLAIIRSVRKRYPATYGVRLNFGGSTVLVSCSTPVLRDTLAAYFTEFVVGPEEPFSPTTVVTAHEGIAPEIDAPFREKQPDPGKTTIKEEYLDCGDGRLVRKRLTGMLFAFSGAEHLAVGPCARNDNQLVNFINSRLIARHLDRGCYLGHAAAVVSRGKGIALCGFAGRGKSTLALFLMNEGCSFVSNDRALLSADVPPQLYGIPKHPRINPGTALNNPAVRGIVDPQERERLAALPPDELWTLEHKYDAPVDRCYGPGRFVLQAPYAGVVVLNWRRGDGAMRIARVNPPDRLDLVGAFRKDTGVFYAPENPQARRTPSLEDYAGRLARAPMLEITGGVDFQAAAGACLAFFHQGK